MPVLQIRRYLICRLGDFARVVRWLSRQSLPIVIAGKGPPPIHSFVFEDVPFPERTMVCDFGDWMACSFHAPPGVSWGILKPRQAVAIANWLQKVKKPIWFGIDANTPEIDHPNFDETRTHWHTGRRRLKGEPGDDVLVASSKMHELNDAFRVYLSNKNKELNEKSIFKAKNLLTGLMPPVGLWFKTQFNQYIWSFQLIYCIPTNWQYSFSLPGKKSKYKDRHCIKSRSVERVLTNPFLRGGCPPIAGS